MPKTLFQHARIRCMETIVPGQVIHIDDELDLFGGDRTLLERNKKILGLGTRHVVDEQTSNNDLCKAAAFQLFHNNGINPQSIDTLIVLSTSHDYHYPASSCILQYELGLSEDCTCFDISGLGCSGYVHGLMVAHSLIESGASKRCLLLVGDLASTHSDRRNRNTNILFGDAATATFLEYTETPCPAWFYTGTRGSGWKSIIAPAGGYNLPVRDDIADLELRDPNGNVWHLWDDIMRGMEVFKFSCEIGPAGIREILNWANLQMADIDYVAFHQANRQIVTNVAAYAKIPPEKYSTSTFAKYGNCSVAAVAVDICRELNQRPADRILLATFGVGLSWGFAIVDMGQAHIGAIETYVTPPDAPTRKQKIAAWIDYFDGDDDAVR